MGGGDADRDKSKHCSSPNRAYKEKEKDPKLWGIFLFGLIGATDTTFAPGHNHRREEVLFEHPFRRKHGEGIIVACKKSMRKRWRVEQIRRMQSVFNRERNKYKRSYKSWKENGPGAYHQHFQQDDWYWKADTSYRDQRPNYRQPQRDSASYPLSHHYSVLGLDRSRTKPYTEDEIKIAFRAKAKQFHPDQNQDDKEVAEAKFKEVMTSYNAIKQERKNLRI